MLNPLIHFLHGSVCAVTVKVRHAPASVRHSTRTFSHRPFHVDKEEYVDKPDKEETRAAVEESKDAVKGSVDDSINIISDAVKNKDGDTKAGAYTRLLFSST